MDRTHPINKTPKSPGASSMQVVPKEIVADRLKALPKHLFVDLRDTIRQVEARGVDLISLAIGDPAEPTPDYIIEALREAALDPHNHQYPTDEQRGMPVFRRAVSRWYLRKYGVDLNPDTEILTLSGSKEGIHHLIMATVNPGDAVLVTNPGYPGYRANILMAGAEIYDVPLMEENGFLPVLDDIPGNICRNAKVFFINYPNNPTGVCADRGFFTDLVSWARNNRVILVHDTPYSEIVFEGACKLSLLEIPGAMDIAVELNSLSKSYNMTGWRIGMAVGNEGIIRAMRKCQENVSSGVFNAIQLAAVRAMDEGDADIDSMLAIYRRRRQIALAAFEQAGFAVRSGGGTFYLWLRTPEGQSSRVFAEHLLANAGVLVTPGSAYGRYGEGYFRVSLTVTDARLEEALTRIQSAMGKIRPHAAGAPNRK
jgi:LL-diaminopimelate aminotransferase